MNHFSNQILTSYFNECNREMKSIIEYNIFPSINKDLKNHHSAARVSHSIRKIEFDGEYRDYSTGQRSEPGFARFRPRPARTPRLETLLDNSSRDCQPLNRPFPPVSPFSWTRKGDSRLPGESRSKKTVVVR